MEEHFFAKYDYFLRVWPEWCSSGIWAPPYPGSRTVGGVVDHQYLPLAAELVQQFEAWQCVSDAREPWAGAGIGEGLARDLNRFVGPLFTLSTVNWSRC